MLWDSLSAFGHLHVVENLQELLRPHIVHVGNMQALYLALYKYANLVFLNVPNCLALWISNEKHRNAIFVANGYLIMQAWIFYVWMHYKANMCNYIVQQNNMKILAI
jgi:hypothetical protein